MNATLALSVGKIREPTDSKLRAAFVRLLDRCHIRSSFCAKLAGREVQPQTPEQLHARFETLTHKAAHLRRELELDFDVLKVDCVGSNNIFGGPEKTSREVRAKRSGLSFLDRAIHRFEDRFISAGISIMAFGLLQPISFVFVLVNSAKLLVNKIQRVGVEKELTKIGGPN